MLCGVVRSARLRQTSSLRRFSLVMCVSNPQKRPLEVRPRVAYSVVIIGRVCALVREHTHTSINVAVYSPCLTSRRLMLHITCTHTHSQTQTAY